MAFTVQDVITAARDRSAWFHRTRVTDAVVARWLSDYVNELIAKATAWDSRYLQQSASVAIAIDGTNVPETAGAGATGGLPVDLDGDDYVRGDGLTGALVAVDLAAAAIYVTERVVTSAAASSVTSTGAGRTTNEDVGRLLHITSGAGAGQVREIASNTADTWVPGDAWDTTPDTTSMMRVIQPAYTATEAVGGITTVPTIATSTAYLVKLDASGATYIDFATPLTISTEQGLTLPAMRALTGGTLYWTDGAREPVQIVGYRRRFEVAGPALTQSGQVIYLVGEAEDWADVASLEIHYTPVAPALTARTDALLLPDDAKGCVIQQAAAFMALRVAGLPDVSLDPTPLVAQGAASELAYLRSLGLRARSHSQQIREAW